MEIFRYILILSVIVIISCIISIIIYFNKYIQAVLFDYSIENFILDDKIGLKWLYLGNEEPDGETYVQNMIRAPRMPDHLKQSIESMQIL